MCSGVFLEHAKPDTAVACSSEHLQELIVG